MEERDQLLLDLVRVLELSVNPELSESCLELLMSRAERSDTAKLTLARAGACQLVWRLVERHAPLAVNEEGRALLRLACDLVVLVLTGDAAMRELYAGGRGELYGMVLKGLGEQQNRDKAQQGLADVVDSAADPDLRVTAVLALGNFAREDEHCERMVGGEDALAARLVKMLPGATGDPRLQHALLSALRNLAIPRANKPLLLRAGLLEHACPLLELDQPPVTFKLLGTMRMLVDSQGKV